MQDSLRRFQFLWDITYLCWNLTTMGYEITPWGPAASQLRVFINYALPSRGLSRLLGWLLGRLYARWCTRRMVKDAIAQFHSPAA